MVLILVMVLFMAKVFLLVVQLVVKMHEVQLVVKIHERYQTHPKYTKPNWLSVKIHKICKIFLVPPGVIDTQKSRGG